MSNLQLFKKIPENEFITELTKLYGINDYDSSYTFTLKDLQNRNIITNLYNLSDKIKEYYINCKYEKYFTDLTEKKTITILRHFLKIINYKVISREKYANGHKYLLYNIVNKLQTINTNNNYIVISFD